MCFIISFLHFQTTKTELYLFLSINPPLCSLSVLMRGTFFLFWQLSLASYFREQSENYQGQGGRGWGELTCVLQKFSCTSPCIFTFLLFMLPFHLLLTLTYLFNTTTLRMFNHLPQRCQFVQCPFSIFHTHAYLFTSPPLGFLNTPLKAHWKFDKKKL